MDRSPSRNGKKTNKQKKTKKKKKKTKKRQKQEARKKRAVYIVRSPDIVVPFFVWRRKKIK